MSDPRGTPTLCADLEAAHECAIPNSQKMLFGSVMEDGQVCMSIGLRRNNPDTGALEFAVYEYVILTRADFNQWMHGMRQWWNEEKANPLTKAVAQ